MTEAAPRTGRSGSSARRNPERYACNEPWAVRGGSPPQTRSASASADTGRPGVSARAATIDRGLREPRSSSAPRVVQDPAATQDADPHAHTVIDSRRTSCGNALIGSRSLLLARLSAARRGSSRSSQAGVHQLRSPSRLIVAGTRTSRTTVASSRIATPSPKPSILIRVPDSVTKPRKTSTMIAAAAVMTPLVAASPRATLPRASPVRS